MEQIGAVVKANFSMDLYEFLKQKVEVESLYNYEIAALLNVEKTIVGKLIRQTGLKRKNGFIRRFENRHGKGSVAKFKNMIEMLETSLSDVARYFGFSREYARQAYLNLFHQPYTEKLHRKKIEKRLLNEKHKGASKKLKIVNQLKLRLTAMGLDPQILYKRGQYHILVNGFKLAFRYSQRPHKVSGKWQFRITYLDPGGHRDCDFLICLCIHEEEKIYYVLPNHIIPKHGICFIPQARVTQSKYACYKEAWDPLFQTNKGIEKRGYYGAKIKSKTKDNCPIWQVHKEGAERKKIPASMRRL